MRQAVGDEQHGGVARQHAARPVVVEAVQVLGQAGAAGPVRHGPHDPAHRDVGVALAQVAGDGRQPGAEHEAVHMQVGVGQRVGEVQQHARVAAHRAGDVGQHHQRHGPHAGALPAHAPGSPVRAMACMVARQSARPGCWRGACGAWRGARRTAPVRPPAAWPAAIRRRSWCRSRPCAALRGRTRCSWPRPRHAAPRAAAAARAWCGNSASARRRFSGGAGAPWRACTLRQHHRHDAAEQVGVAPEDVEGLVEQRAVLGTIDEAGGEGGMEVAAALPALRPRSACSAAATAVGAARHAGRTAQHAGEVHDVFRQVAGQRRQRLIGRHARACDALPGPPLPASPCAPAPAAAPPPSPARGRCRPGTSAARPACSRWSPGRAPAHRAPAARGSIRWFRRCRAA